MSAQQQEVLQHGIVKQVLSGDTIIVRGPPRGGPPQERTICLSNVTAPQLARRPNPSSDASLITSDQPYAWEAREMLRKLLVGKDITFTVEYKPPGTTREYGCVYMGKDTTGQNLTELMISEGLVEVRRGGINRQDEKQGNLIALEDTAKAGLKGKWGPAEEVAKHVRDIKWTVDNPRQLVDSYKGNPVEAVIEHVRDGCTVRAFLLPSFQYVTVLMSGIKAPMFKIEGDKTMPEQFAEEAKFFVEARLLQRSVNIVLDAPANQNLLGTIVHPNGSIAEFLLKEGLARCADWSITFVSSPEKLRAAEKVAKEKKLRMWKDYQATVSTVDIKDKNFTAKVIEVINADGLVVKLQDGTQRKIFLSSIRFPRPQPAEGEEPAKRKTRPRPLYDIPYMFDAREFLRKKIIGKKVNVTVDYIQPAANDFPEKTCTTVMFNNINVAEALLSKGLAMCVRYRQDDDQRSGHYDELLKAEERAKKKGAGLHSKKEPPVIRVADISGDATKSKQFLPFLQRAGRCDAVVEFVSSGSRLRLYIPKETCLITFLLSGISCPRASRPAPGGGGNMIPDDPFGEEALVYTKERTLQHEVEVEVEAMDKGGNFIGWLYVDGVNMSLGLVEHGLAKVHFTAERSPCYRAMCTAEEKVKASRTKIWADYEEPKEETVVPENEPTERKISYKTVVVTEVGSDLKFFAQNVETGTKLEQLMEQLRTDLASNPPLSGSYTPKRGDLCAAKFTDGEWYRGRVEKVQPKGGVHILYMDYGNREVTDATKLATLPAGYQALPPQATEYCLACLTLPQDVEDARNAVDTLYNDVLNSKLHLNTEYRVGSQEFVTLVDPESKDDVGHGLLADGLVLLEKRKEKRLAKLMETYRKAQDTAKSARMNLWRYGDFTEDDAKEFGYSG